jgi:hypothetical protein
MYRRRKGEKNMTTPYKFAALPSNSSVVALVTMLVSGWFLLASGAILTDRKTPQNYAAEDVRLVPVVTVTAVREEPFKVVVTANRSGRTLPSHSL